MKPIATILRVSLLASLLVLPAPARENSPTISHAAASQATGDAHGFLRHVIRSAYQAGTTTLRVLLPDSAARCAGPYRVLLVLPVEPGEEHRYGDGLTEIKRLGLHNKYQLICVQPTFSQLPWYADHPSDPQIRQEAYLLNDVVPLLKRSFPIAAGRANWLLLGFSKSGWGAWSLLLRHPDLFGRATAWDAPLAMTAPSKYGMGPIFGTQQNFERYEILTALDRHAAWLRTSPRLGLFGYGNFRAQHETVHARLVELGIPVVDRDGPHREHIWESGWIPEAVEFLVSPPPKSGSRGGSAAYNVAQRRWFARFRFARCRRGTRGCKSF